VVLVELMEQLVKEEGGMIGLLHVYSGALSSSYFTGLLVGWWTLKVWR